MSTPTKAEAVFQDAYTSKSGIPFLPKISNGYGTFAVFRSLSNPADGELWADATNVYTETGFTPSQLAEQRAELFEALRALVETVDYINKNPVGVKFCDLLDYRNAIAKATQTHQVIATAHHDPELNATIVTPE